MISTIFVSVIAVVIFISRQRHIKLANHNRLLATAAIRVIAKSANTAKSAKPMAKLIDQWGEALDYREYDKFMSNLCKSNGVVYSCGANGLISDKSKIALSKELCYVYA